MAKIDGVRDEEVRMITVQSYLRKILKE